MQPEYEIPVAAIAGSTLRLRDDVKCSFYVVARQQSGALRTGAGHQG